MRTVVIGVLGVIICVLGFAIRSDHALIEKLQQQLAESKWTPVEPTDQKQVALAQPTVMASMEQQDKCAKQAAVRFKLDGWSGDRGADFTSHFNVKLGRCFVSVTNSTMYYGKPAHSKNVVDAFEGKVFANYFWLNSENKQFYEVKPMECKVTLPTGEDVDCKTDTEFDELIKVYME